MPRVDFDPRSLGRQIETMLNIRAARRGLKIAEVPSYEADRIHAVVDHSGNRWQFTDKWAQRVVDLDRAGGPICRLLGQERVHKIVQRRRRFGT